MQAITNYEKLYNLYKENPLASNAEVGEAFGWSENAVRKYAFVLRKRGFIETDSTEGVTILKEYPSTGGSASMSDFKQEAYKRLYDICVDRAENNEISNPQFISLVQEIRLVLDRII